MFHLDVMNKKLANFDKSVVNTDKAQSSMGQCMLFIFLQLVSFKINFEQNRSSS